MPPVKPKTQHAWLAHYPAHVPATLKLPGGGLPALLQATALRYPRRPYLTFFGRDTSYTQALAQAEHFAATLQAMALPPHSRIALCLPNCPTYVISFWGILLAGHVVVNLNPLLTSRELALELKDSAATVLITFNLQPTLTKVQEALRAMPANQPAPHVWLADLADDMPPLTALGFKLLKLVQRVGFLPKGMHWLPDVLDNHHPYRAVKLTPKQTAILQYTGGTTGTPKAAVLSHGALTANALQVKTWLGEPQPQGETILAVLPLFHVLALTAVLTMGTAIGARLVLMPQFNLAALLKLIKRTQPTLLPGVPALFQALATHPLALHADLSCLRFCISGGAPLPTATRQAFEARVGAKLIEGYGLTEASPVLACGPSHGHVPASSAGYPLPNTVIEIRSPTAPYTRRKGVEVGEIWAQGPQLMDGYWRNPKATKQVLKAGWLRTGDMGFLDATGALHVVDRIKDMIIVNGYKVYPRQVEEVLAQHPSIAEVLVLGIPHARSGEAVKAFVVAKPGHTLTPAMVLAWSHPHLNKLSRLAAVEVRHLLPKSSLGKPSRKDLAAEERAKHGK